MIASDLYIYRNEFSLTPYILPVIPALSTTRENQTMSTSASYRVFQLANAGSLAHPAFSLSSDAIATGAVIVDDNNSTHSSINILGDTPSDSFSIVGFFSSPDTQNGSSDAITDALAQDSLLYRGYVTTTYLGTTYNAMVGYDVNTDNYFLLAPSVAPAIAFTDPTVLVYTKTVVASASTQWQIKQDAPFCFLSGTMLRTPSGERAIESLRAGDLVLTASGVAKPVRWIGMTVVATKFADKQRMMPVRIKAQALAENVPCRDLLVSSGHGVMVDGLLVHAGALVNGTSIVRETEMPALFTYFHVETDSHDLLVAENTPAESFLEAVGDIRLDNFPERAALAGNAAAVEMDMPRVKSARQLPAALRSTLSARAALHDENHLVAA